MPQQTVAEKVIVFSTADWDAPYRTNKQHVAELLAKRGASVLYVESVGLRRPGANVRDLGRIWRRLKKGLAPPATVQPRVDVLSPLVLPFGHRNRLIRWLNGAVLRRSIAKWCRNRGAGATQIWAYHPYIFDAIGSMRGATLIYHCVDDVGAVPGVDGDAFYRHECELLARADHVFATSPYLRERCEVHAPGRCTYERNVADISRFAQARTMEPSTDIAAIDGPKLVYVGVLSSFKLDFGLVETVAGARPDWQWILIGEEPEGQADPTLARLRSRSNVHLLGYRTAAELPAYLAGADLAVLPNRTDDYMKGVFPMKLYEYLAAGLPVVSTRLDALRERLDQVRIGHGADDFQAAIASTLDAPPPALALDDPQLAAYSWDARMDRMLAVINKASA